MLGVNALTQAAVEQALRIGGAEIERRRASVIRERTRLLEALEGLPVDAEPSQANFVWLAAHGMSGAALASRLARENVIVAPGWPPRGRRPFARDGARLGGHGATAGGAGQGAGLAADRAAPVSPARTA